MKYLLVKSNGNISIIDLPKGIVAKREAIGGYDVEFITLNYAMTLQICLAEAGKIYQLPRNDLATKIYQQEWQFQINQRRRDHTVIIYIDK